MGDWLLHALLSSALLALVAATVCRTRAVSPAAAHLLWAAVLVHLLLPPIGRWPAALIVLDRAAAAPLPAPAPVDSAAPAAPTENGSPAPLPRPSPQPPARAHARDASAAAAALWLAGALAVALRLARDLRRLHRAQTAASPPPPELLELVRAVSVDVGVRCPRVRVGEAWPSACLSALGPTLLVPAHLLASSDPAMLRAVIAHELVHLRRRDHLLGWLEAAARIAWWWNPVQWFACARLHACAELACDAAVVSLLPQARRSYAQALVDTAARVSVRGTAPALALGGFGKRAFAQRLRLIMTSTPRSRISKGETMLATVLTLVTFPAWSATTTPIPDLAAQDPGRVPVQEPAQPPAQQDRWRVDLKQQRELPAAVRMLRMKTGAGDIEVVEGTTAGLEIEAVATAPKDRVPAGEVSQRFEDHVSVETQDGVLTITQARDGDDGSEGRHDNPWSVSLRVRVPRALAVEAATGSGDIEIASAAETVTAKTGSGDVRLSSAQDPLDEVRIGTGSGTIEAAVDLISKQAQLSTGSGDITLQVGRTGRETASLTTGSGDVTVLLPANAGAQLELRTGSGELTAPGGVESERRTVGGHAKGTIGGGGAQYRVTTGSGDVDVSVGGRQDGRKRV